MLAYGLCGMSVEVKTRALILQRYPYRERSWVLKVHTETEGTIAVLALGRSSMAFLPGALLRLRLLVRPHRELQRLAEAEWDYLYRRLYHDPARQPYLFVAVEWLAQCLMAPDPALYGWVRHQLIELDETPEPQAHLLRFFTELLPRLGGALPERPTSLQALEAVYQATWPAWRPLRSLSLLETLPLPTYADRKSYTRRSSSKDD